MLARIAQSLYRRFLGPRVEAWFFRDLIQKTENFSHVTWLGTPVWQNVLDLWVRTRKFLISHHPKGWLRRKPTMADTMKEPARKPDLRKE